MPRKVQQLQKKTNRSTRPAIGKSRTPASKKGFFRSLFISQRNTTSRTRSTAVPARSRGFLTNLSLDRRLDLLGIGLFLTGVLTLLSLASTPQGSFAVLIRQGFGWGVYLLPVGLLLVGLWLVIRNFKRIPRLSIERIMGAFLLYANLLAVLHLVYFPKTAAETFTLAAHGEGGGYIGGTIFQTLQSAFGTVGVTISLIAWMLIALMLTLDVSVVDLFRWMKPLFHRVLDAWEDFRSGDTKFSRKKPVPSLPSPGIQEKPPEKPQIIRPTSPFVSTNLPPGFTTSTPSITTWALPSVQEILEPGTKIDYHLENDQHRVRVIEETLSSFGAPVRVVDVKRGPTITLFGVEPDFIETRSGKMRVRVGKIASLADDLALALSARTIRIQAPVPGKGYVGIEVPNDEISIVALRDVIESEAFKRLKSPLRFALGQDVAGNAVAADLAAMPHLLIAGTTGSGKSVCVNSIVTCLLLHNTPNELRLIMVDPKRVELSNYNGIPHLLAPVVVELGRVVGALQWVTREMDLRYHKLAQAGTRNIAEFNALLEARGEKKQPYLLVIIDELADLMMLAPDETERTLTRLAQLARATGIHLVIATQRPSVDVVTGLIKANFPARIAFAVASGVDSRVILDQPGAERLLGRGDMLFQAPDAAAPVRLQGTFVSDAEILQLVEYWQRFSTPTQVPVPTLAGGMDLLPPGAQFKQMPLWKENEASQNLDPLLNESIDLARRQGRASVSMLQRRFRIGYTRAARLVDTMEEMGIVGPPHPGTGTRDVLDYGPAAPPVEEQ